MNQSAKSLTLSFPKNHHAIMPGTYPKLPSNKPTMEFPSVTEREIPSEVLVNRLGTCRIALVRDFMTFWLRLTSLSCGK